MWGTVCYQDTTQSELDFNIVSASVACFQLGFAGAQTWFRKEHFGPGRASWMRNVNCTGSETRLDQCRHDWCTNDHHCHYCDRKHFDVGISCEGDYGSCEGWCRPTLGRVRSLKGKALSTFIAI